MRNDEPDALDRALDNALDNALAQYSSEEPLAGLEQRVLNRVRAEGAAPRFGFGWVAAAGVAVMAGMVVAAVWWERPVPPPPPVGQASWPVRQHVQTQATPAGFRKKRGQARRPVPLSSEERALLALVARAPDQAREALLDLQRRSTEPIQVEAIRIEPLRSDDAK
jgi:hypothetical protein